MGGRSRPPNFLLQPGTGWRARAPARGPIPRGRATLMRQTRREFLADVGRGVVIAGVGSALAADLGLGAAWAGEPAEVLTFGRLEALVALMQETPPARLLPILVEKLKGGTD